MIRFVRATFENKDFQKLAAALEADLRIRDGSEHACYTALNKADSLPFVVVAYDDEIPVGCGALRPFSDQSMEVKRMYVAPGQRGKGIASGILLELEREAQALHFSRCVLETGKNQPEAIGLYLKSGYKVIPNFGQYENSGNSICFEKPID